MTDMSRKNGLPNKWHIWAEKQMTDMSRKYGLPNKWQIWAENNQIIFYFLNQSLTRNKIPKIRTEKNTEKITQKEWLTRLRVQDIDSTQLQKQKTPRKQFNSITYETPYSDINSITKKR